MAAFAFIPILNLIFYSGHGGIAFFVLPFVFPLALLFLYLEHKGASAEKQKTVKVFAITSLVAYIPLSFLAASAAAATLRTSMGYDMTAEQLWAFFIMPFGLLIVALP